MALPGILADIADAAGEAAALQLARERGGTELSVSDRKGSVLVRIVGQDAATAIQRALGRGRILVPMANVRGARGRRAAAVRLMAAGAGNTEVALACDVHERTARRIRRRLGGDGPLFE